MNIIPNFFEGNRLRIGYINPDRCKHTKCSHQCFKACPIVRSGIKVITIPNDPNLPAWIAEDLCEGAGICVKVCPFRAIKMINLPTELKTDLIHQYSENGFRLYRLPLMKNFAVTGIIGQNGLGKSTALNILSGSLVPNLGDYKNQIVQWDKIIKYFRGTEAQNIFTKLANQETRCIIKPQYIDRIPQLVHGTVSEVLQQYDEKGKLNKLKEEFQLDLFWNREIKQLSGGELQKFALCIACEREADIYLFDEPSSFLDVTERIRMAKIVRNLALEEQKTVICVEHDLAILDYLSDFICLLYGEQAAYGIATSPIGVREGINEYLTGYIRSENMQIRENPIYIRKTTKEEPKSSDIIILKYNKMRKKYENFNLTIFPGKIYRNEIIGILGPNRIGKTTFLRILLGLEQPTEGRIDNEITMAYKPQYISTTEDLTVQEKLNQIKSSKIQDNKFKSDVIRPFGLDNLLEQPLINLSGGELQKVMIAYCLAQDAELFLFDEPSAYLSIEERLNTAKIIHRHIFEENKAALVVEHDLLLLDYVSNSLIVFEGQSGVKGKANNPTTLEKGMNHFLSDLDITFRRDEITGRPRINKQGSRLDREQKAKGIYFYTV